MSGGPVLNEQGRLCGIICSNMPPPPGHEDGGHVSYVSTLWPAMGTMVDCQWDGRYPLGTFYPVYEMAKAGIIHARDLDFVEVTVRADGTQTVRCRRYDR